MSRGKRRKKKAKPPKTVSAWGDLDQAMTVLGKLDVDDLSTVCGEVEMLVRVMMEAMPMDNDDSCGYPLPQVMIALSGYIDSLALNIRNVWVREEASEKLEEDAEEGQVRAAVKSVMDESAGWRVAGVLLGQKQTNDTNADMIAEEAKAMTPVNLEKAPPSDGS